MATIGESCIHVDRRAPPLDHEPLARPTEAARLNFKGRCGRRTGVRQDMGSMDRRPPGIGGPSLSRFDADE